MKSLCDVTMKITQFPFASWPMTDVHQTFSRWIQNMSFTFPQKVIMKVDKKILLKQFFFHDGVTLRFHNCGRDSKMNLHNQEVGSPMQRMHFPPTKTTPSKNAMHSWN